VQPREPESRVKLRANSAAVRQVFGLIGCFEDQAEAAVGQARKISSINRQKTSDA
jgi:hypothetical protein